MVKHARLYNPQLIRRLVQPVGRHVKRYWQGGWWHKLLTAIVLLVTLTGGGMYGIAEWYIHSEAGRPLQLGVSFIPDYAQSLGVNPQQTMDALIGIGVKQFRLVSYWSDMEPTPGHYDFSQLDWEFAKADAAHAQVTLAIGLRQPRWPECHAPNWINTSAPESQWVPQLDQFMTTVIARYGHNPALQSYQLENEFFNTFGQCPDDNRARLVSEFNLVKQLDPRHPIIVSRSNNYGGLQLGQPQPDIAGISVYRRVWSPWVGRYTEYPFPSWYYAFLAGSQKILTGKDSVLHELQAEPWPPDGKTITQISLAEQNKSFNARDFTATVNFAKNTGMRQIDLWGAEYWYYRQQVLHDPSLMNVARQEFSASAQH